MRQEVEIYCGSYYDAIQADYGGASRIVLSQHTFQGSLTPSIANLLKTKEELNLEVNCMIKARESGYYYHQEEIDCMFLDAEILLDNGADGIVFGFLDEESDIDIGLTRKMIELVHSYKKKAYFNQAIDLVADIETTLNVLTTMEIDGIYTMGQQKNLILGKEMIKYIQSLYGEYMQIIAVGETDEIDVKEYMHETGIHMIQGLCMSHQIDPTNSFTYDYPSVSWEKVEILVNEVEEELYDYEFM